MTPAAKVGLAPAAPATAEVNAIVLMEHRPAEVLAEAQRAAAALAEVIKNKPHPVMMNGEQYLEFEDWQTLGRFYGITAREDGDAEFVEFGAVRGFKASAVAIHRGEVISRATAFCLSDEEKWGSRPKYQYHYVTTDGELVAEDPGPDRIRWEANPSRPGKRRPVKERVRVADEAVPLYQLASMAQTRACAKTLRNVLSWVAVLAGYKTTPAEELPADADHVVDAEPTSRTPPKASPSAAAEPTLTAPQCALLFTQARGAGLAGKPAVYDLATKVLGRPIRSAKGIRQSELDAVLKALPAVVASEPAPAVGELVGEPDPYVPSDEDIDWLPRSENS
jgi:hypothetical protein